MPTCIHCNRPFLNKEALHQHLASSGSQHPFCKTCDRRFISQVALDSHISAKHPPSYGCEICKKNYTAPFALDDHYRGSAAHPNCARCGKGFKDVKARDEHRNTAHSLFTCTICDDISIDEDATQEHYKDSDNHPSCTKCGWGFKDETTYANHIALFHPKLRPVTEDPKTINSMHMHPTNLARHKKCECGHDCKDEADYLNHVQKDHTPTALVPKYSNTQDRDRDRTSTNMYRRDLPPPSQVIGQATWGSVDGIPRRPSFAPLYVPPKLTQPLAPGQTLYSSTGKPTFSRTEPRRHEPTPDPRRTSKQWPVDRNFNIQNSISPPIPTQSKKETRFGSSQQPIPSPSQRNSWRPAHPQAGKNDNLGLRAGYTGSTASRFGFNPFGPLSEP